MQPQQERIQQLSEQLELVGFYLYVPKEAGRVEARMFAPRYAIPEESATGMAAGALAFARPDLLLDARLLIEQGHLMPRPSPALLQVDQYDAQRVLVSGAALLEGVRRLRVD